MTNLKPMNETYLIRSQLRTKRNDRNRQCVERAALHGPPHYMSSCLISHAVFNVGNKSNIVYRLCMALSAISNFSKNRHNFFSFKLSLLRVKFSHYERQVMPSLSYQVLTC